MNDNRDEKGRFVSAPVSTPVSINTFRTEEESKKLLELIQESSAKEILEYYDALLYKYIKYGIEGSLEPTQEDTVYTLIARDENKKYIGAIEYSSKDEVLAVIVVNDCEEKTVFIESEDKQILAILIVKKELVVTISRMQDDQETVNYFPRN